MDIRKVAARVRRMMLRDLFTAHVTKRVCAVNGAAGSCIIKKICAKSRKFRNPEKRLDKNRTFAYNETNQRLSRAKAEDMSQRSAHLTERMLTR